LARRLSVGRRINFTLSYIHFGKLLTLQDNIVMRYVALCKSRLIIQLVPCLLSSFLISRVLSIAMFDEMADQNA